MEKLVVSKMMVEGTNRRIHTVDRHAGIVRVLRRVSRRLARCPSKAPDVTRRVRQAVAGLAPDGRVLVTRARSEAAQYVRRVVFSAVQCHTTGKGLAYCARSG